MTRLNATFRFEWNKLISTLIVGLIMLTFGLLIPLLNSSISPEKKISEGIILNVGLGTSFKPVEGWSMNTEYTSPGDDLTPGSTGISKAGLIFSVKAEKFDGTLEEFHSLLWDRFNKINIHDYSMFNRKDITTEKGLPGFFRVYYGNGTQGQFASFLDNGVGVSFAVSGPDGIFFQYYTEIRDMVKSLNINYIEAEKDD